MSHSLHHPCTNQTFQQWPAQLHEPTTTLSSLPTKPLPLLGQPFLSFLNNSSSQSPSAIRSPPPPCPIMKHNNHRALKSTRSPMNLRLPPPWLQSVGLPGPPPSTSLACCRSRLCYDQLTACWWCGGLFSKCLAHAHLVFSRRGSFRLRLFWFEGLHHC